MDEERLNYKNIVILGIVFILIAMFFLGGFGMRSDSYRMYNAFFCPLRDSLVNQGSLVGWDVHRAGGQPAASSPDAILFELCYFFYLIFNDSNISTTLCLITYVLFGTLGMYLLVFRLTKNNKSAVLSCIFFWFWISYKFIIKETAYIVPHVSIPWIFLLYERMGRNIKRVVLNSTLIGLLLTIGFLAAGMTEILWILFIFPIFVVFDLFVLSNPLVRFSFKVKKVLVILLVLMISFSGLVAFKMYPSAKFIEKTNRAEGFSMNEFIGQKLELRDFLEINLLGQERRIKTGLTSLVLVIAGLFLGFKKKNFLKFFMIFVLGIIVTANLFSVANLLALVPVLNKARHILRFGLIYQFSVAVLMGLSFSYICKYLTKKGLKKWISVVFILLIVLLSFELLYINTIKYPAVSSTGRSLRSEVDKQAALRYLEGVDSERHRIHMLGKDWVEGGEGEQFFCFIGIETMDWVFGNAWLVDYTTFTMWAGSNLEQAAKLWGMLNTKYITAVDPNLIKPAYTKSIFEYKNDTDYFVPGLKLVKKFQSCDGCSPDITHLYENTRFLPRVFFVNKSILLVGERDKLYDLYAFMLFNSNFEPRTTALIGRESIIDEDLSRYSAVILTQQITPVEIQKLQQFKDSGGEVFPDIFADENSVNVERLGALLQEFGKEESYGGAVTEKFYSPNHRTYVVENELDGFLVVSENFYTYKDEWLATLNSQDKEIYNANFVVSAIYLDNEKGELEFRYNPVYFKRGSIVSIITLCLVVLVFILFRRKKDHSLVG